MLSKYCDLNEISVCWIGFSGWPLTTHRCCCCCSSRRCCCWCWCCKRIKMSQNSTGCLIWLSPQSLRRADKIPSRSFFFLKRNHCWQLQNKGVFTQLEHNGALTHFSQQEEEKKRVFQPCESQSRRCSFFFFFLCCCYNEKQTHQTTMAGKKAANANNAKVQRQTKITARNSHQWASNMAWVMKQWTEWETHNAKRKWLECKIAIWLLLRWMHLALGNNNSVAKASKCKRRARQKRANADPTARMSVKMRLNR